MNATVHTKEDMIVLVREIAKKAIKISRNPYSSSQVKIINNNHSTDCTTFSYISPLTNMIYSQILKSREITRYSISLVVHGQNLLAVETLNSDDLANLGDMIAMDIDLLNRINKTIPDVGLSDELRDRLDKAKNSHLQYTTVVNDSSEDGK